ncbi:entericidin A/B family lipoprotein [Sphingomicrobium lutaoense]|uniref:Putative small secreted protein n=1 Tax=Sphingomicrobium lutaoense TaxID=515949 RepID=A0A839Z3Q1_9SPHN|nr:entericidin A/B family lipoprotein [Sphingomicrobium lutaoense]MBB3764232.1 putative small secreted protein [Sphingomicrobium lutaoense]
MVRKLMSVFAIGSLMALSACNTVQGAGKDIESAGKCGEDVLEGRDC